MTDYSAYKHFTVSFPSDSVAHVEINRPQKLNAFNRAMWLEYGTLFNLLSVDPNIRAIVLSGSGPRAFCSGLDLMSSDVLTKEDPTVDPARKAAEVRRFIKEFQDSISTVESCEKPVICVLHGIAYGLAIDISSCADIRIAAKDVKLAVKEVDIGIAADIGTLSRLPKIVGSLGWVKEVAYTARVFGAEEALREGFLQKVVETKEAAIEEATKLAKLMAEKSPLGVQGTKAIINYSIDHSTAEGLEFTKVWNAAAVQAPDPKIAIEATLMKKKAVFAKL
ncbi:enoyl-CoA hydratase/isomerase family protein [Pyronema domesticum]|uniref:Similar to Delta(3,5)-Delta(2,4)-dienoyl-CoA isomerase, mitochondrial acc. no. Q62651 n=1 Tax=Pyronema omphalodes (strain CBS 100304) TaxID=1076935 RepID=U4KZ99_PYROM|nr:enoyl-CoA hydratase/isomerase family protein [Pyronema domesticum]CCX07040.1 Similar to Delta(3,5)-Delta(2,4)-dienoyl-CoA isomerase, mitochondrial; acc. no. Q62651 [Pyronema omphalodes CBS 100304]